MDYTRENTSEATLSSPGGSTTKKSYSDDDILASLGYKQELKRHFSLLEVFGLAFSIMGPLPSIASTLTYSIPAGPAGMVWGWFLASMGIFVVGMALSDLGSAMPTSGGLYWWTHRFASPKTRNYLSFLVGYSNALGLIGSLCSVDYGFAVMICSIVSIATDGAWKPNDGILYLVYFACLTTHASIASTLSKYIGKLQSFSVIMNIVVILATAIALPIGRSRAGTMEPALNVMQIENLTNWPTGWTFMLAWLSPIWSMAGFSSCANIAEEADNAAKAVPYGMLLAIANAWGFGFIILIVMVSCMSSDLQHYLHTPHGQPMAQIYYDAVGKEGTIVMMILLVIVQFLMGLSVLVAVSRQMWAFSRDGGLPYSSIISRVSKNFHQAPFHAIWTAATISAALGLLALADTAAASALFAMACAGNNVSWAIPIFSRLVWAPSSTANSSPNKTIFRPGPFYTGPKASNPIAILALLFLAFGTILALFPSQGPNPAPGKMNYAVVVNAAVWIGATGYYFLDARKWFTGPKRTADAAPAPLPPPTCTPGGVKGPMVIQEKNGGQEDRRREMIATRDTAVSGDDAITRQHSRPQGGVFETDDEATIPLEYMRPPPPLPWAGGAAASSSQSSTVVPDNMSVRTPPTTSGGDSVALRSPPSSSTVGGILGRPLTSRSRSSEVDGGQADTSWSLREALQLDPETGK